MFFISKYRMGKDYSKWCLQKPNRLYGRTHEQWLEEYTRWKFGPFPYHRIGDPLFASGNIKPNTGCRRHVNLIDGPDSSIDIYENDPIILEAIGVNFIIGDADRSGNIITNDADILRAFDFEDTMHSKAKVEFKNIDDGNFVNLSRYVEQTRNLPFQFLASNYNPYLNDWDIPLPVGDHRGAMSSQLFIMQIPAEGEYLLKFEAKSFFDYESCGIYQINVMNKDVEKHARVESNMKDRYVDIKDKVISVNTGKVIPLSSGKNDTQQQA